MTRPPLPFRIVREIGRAFAYLLAVLLLGVTATLAVVVALVVVLSGMVALVSVLTWSSPLEALSHFPRPGGTGGPPDG